MKTKDLFRGLAGLPNLDAEMTVLFIGHGSPTNAIKENEFSRAWEAASRELARPAAILCISAHWETEGTRVTAMESPKTIHDFHAVFADRLRLTACLSTIPRSPQIWIQFFNG